MKTQWTGEQSWEWYRNMPWLRGCNYLPSDCCNRIAMWQELEWDQHLATMEREFGLLCAPAHMSATAKEKDPA